ncbi:hypothetical protein HDU98_002352 [Podochytrium sp. JEL0797]|nr:hypothetical protein HDU98_002352 [Podochytrium sp. JEL0797]
MATHFETVAATSFPAFCANQALVLDLFSRLTSRNLTDYRLKIRPTSAGFEVLVKTQSEPPPPGSDANDPSKGPRTFTHCLSCDPEIATIAENNYEGGEAGRGPPEGLPPTLKALTTQDCEIMNLSNPLIRVWLDAQARPLIIVTPRRHLGGMEEMNDAEIAALWGSVGRVISEFGNGVFKEVVLNVGQFRNIAHSHVKVWFRDDAFLKQMEHWGVERRKLFGDLHELRRLMKFPREDALRREIGNVDGAKVELFLKGEFVSSGCREELAEKFGKFGQVAEIRIPGDAGYLRRDGAVVVMTRADDAIRATINLNLTRFGRNVMCKIKLLKNIK